MSCANVEDDQPPTLCERYYGLVATSVNKEDPRRFKAKVVKWFGRLYPVPVLASISGMPDTKEATLKRV